MKYIVLNLTLFLGLFSAVSFADEDLSSKQDKYRSTINNLMNQLKAELQTAKKEGGAVKAIEICNTKAPEISAKVSKEVGFTVARTSLKPRNSDNAPDAWETKVLEQFEQRKVAGEKPKKLEFIEVVKNEAGQRQVRYMKAIRTGAPCLGCHGTDIDPAIATKLQELYPEDKALGFEAGDLRGAFSITETLSVPE
jgi:hypothetical protein